MREDKPNPNPGPETLLSTCHDARDVLSSFCWNTKGIRQRPRQNVVLTNLGLRLFRIVVKVIMRATAGRVKMEDG